MDLKERLAEVASEVADVRPPVGLWDREVRRRTRARRDTAVAVLAACLAIAGLLVGSWHASRQPAPAAPHGQVAIPDHVYEVSRWLPGTDKAGELGRLVAISITDRATWRGKRPGVVGISATTGEYRFLDLPDLADPRIHRVALSPDGLHLAYWTRGSTTDSPSGGSAAVTGVALYDAVTGEVRRAPVRTSFEPTGLFFTDARTLAVLYGWFTADWVDEAVALNAKPPGPALLWDLAGASPHAVSLPDDFRPLSPAARNGRLWTAWDVRHGPLLVDLHHGIRVRRLGEVEGIPGFSGLGSEGALSPDGSKLALIPGSKVTDRASSRVTLYDLTPRRGCCGRGRTLSDLAPTRGAVAWIDQTELVLLQDASDASLPNGESRDQLVAVDTVGGATRVVTRFPVGDNNGAEWAWAVDLLDSPSTPGVRPPHPWDPRVTTAGIALIVGAALWLIRQRRRRRGGP